MCMTEPEAGTDVLGMRTTAQRDGDHYVLNGRKTFITNGAVDDHTLGDVFLVYARTGERSISTLVVERDAPGFSLGQRLKEKLGMRASMTAELVFDDCRVPADNLLGAEGESLLHMMRNLELERLTLAAMSLGIAQRCLRVMVDYASQRKAFGVPIREFGQIQRHIAESYAEYKAARCYVYDTARRLDLDRARQPRRRRRHQAVRRARRQGDRRPRHPGARRLRLHGRVRRRTPVARRQAARDRRRHARSAPEEHHQGPGRDAGADRPLSERAVKPLGVPRA